LRRLAFTLLLIVLVLLAAVFAYSNPQPIDIEIGFARLDQVSMAAAFTVVFALGWLFGLLSTGLTLWRAASEKRRLRKDLRYAEAQLTTFRGAKLQDAH
jgi:uncharacterized membrane protein YciS (DUF1049 family)